MFSDDDTAFGDTLGDVFRGMVAGVIGGAAGAWMMNNWHEHAQRQRQSQQPARATAGGGSSDGGAAAKAGSEPQRAKAEGAGDDKDATVKTAEMISRNLFDHELSDQEKQIAGPVVHYGYGMFLGGVYGALAELWPNVKTGFGMFYGMMTWVLGDEIAVPALKLAPPPHKVDAQAHLEALSKHVCFGLTLDFCRRFAKLLI